MYPYVLSYRTCTTSITAPHQCSCSARYNGLDVDAHITQSLGCVQAGASINGHTKSGRARVVERYLICQHCLIYSGGEGGLCRLGKLEMGKRKRKEMGKERKREESKKEGYGLEIAVYTQGMHELVKK